MQSLATLAIVSLAIALSPTARAGELTVAQRGSTLKLTGSDSVSFEMRGIATGDILPTAGLVRVIPDAGTTVNGLETEFIFANVTQLQVSLGSGGNGVLLNGLDLSGGLTLKGGPDKESVTIQYSQLDGNVSLDLKSGAGSVLFDTCAIGGKIDVKGGAGADSVSLYTCNAAKSVKVSLGEGQNSFGGNIVNAGDVSVKTGSGDDLFVWTKSSGNGAMKFDAGSGANTLTVSQSEVENLFSWKSKGNGDSIAVSATHFLGSAVLQLGDGNNEASLDDTAINKNLTITGGSGDDDIEANGGTTVGGKVKINLGRGMNTAPAL